MLKISYPSVPIRLYVRLVPIRPSVRLPLVFEPAEQTKQGRNVNVWGKISREGSPPCLRCWGICRVFNLSLKDQWEKENSKVFLQELDAFFQSVSTCLEMSQVIKDETAYLSCMIASCYQPGAKHPFSFANTR